MTKWIYSFEEGSANDKDLLGGKGANLAEMSRLGLPVPPGFTITTQSCINYLDNPDFFDSTLKEDILKAVTHLEKKTEKMLKQLQKHRITSRQCMREGLYGMPIGAGNCKSLCSSVQHMSFRQIFLLNFVKYPCNTTVFLRIFSLSA